MLAQQRLPWLQRLPVTESLTVGMTSRPNTSTTKKVTSTTASIEGQTTPTHCHAGKSGFESQSHDPKKCEQCLGTTSSCNHYNYSIAQAKVR